MISKNLSEAARPFYCFICLDSQCKLMFLLLRKTIKCKSNVYEIVVVSVWRNAYAFGDSEEGLGPK